MRKRWQWEWKVGEWLLNQDRWHFQDIWVESANWITCISLGLVARPMQRVSQSRQLRLFFNPSHYYCFRGSTRFPLVGHWPSPLSFLSSSVFLLPTAKSSAFCWLWTNNKFMMLKKKIPQWIGAVCCWLFMWKSSFQPVDFAEQTEIQFFFF